MRRAAALLLIALVAAAAASSDRQEVIVRGVPQDLYHLGGSTDRQPFTVLFIPGDGGWRGRAVEIAENIASFGYDVYGLDTKRYLTGFTGGDKGLTIDEMSSDLAEIEKRLGAGQPRVVIVGWSQGASMAVLAAARPETKRYLKGIVTIGLPEYGVLGWTWKDTLAVAAKREPGEPKFYSRKFLPLTSPVPFFAIHGTNDDYTPPATAREMFALAGGPKQFQLVDGANHRFDGHLDEFYRLLGEALHWVRRDSQ